MSQYVICESKEDLARRVAAEIVDLIKAKKRAGQNCVLCLPTGSTPIPVYQEIVRKYNEEPFPLDHVYTFNLDEYCGLPYDHQESYHFFMNHNLFSHIPLKKDQIHVPEGYDDEERARAFAAEYEAKIKRLGGFDLALLGIGRTGHIGFNEPGSNADSRTRRVVLHQVTRDDAAPSFPDRPVPTHAVTQGIGTILEARKIIMMATGANKKEIMIKYKEAEPTPEVPATFLKQHPNVEVFVDRAAAGLN
ncbi:hypothetical protein RCL1_002894 [Eukaryota sp. TZLM3-RCL]